MNEYKPYIHHEEHRNYMMGVMVFGPWALPLWIPVSIYGVLLGLSFVGGVIIGGMILNTPDMSPMNPFFILLGIGAVVGGAFGLYKFFSAMRASIREVNGKDRY